MYHPHDFYLNILDSMFLIPSWYFWYNPLFFWSMCIFNNGHLCGTASPPTWEMGNQQYSRMEGLLISISGIVKCFFKMVSNFS